MKIKKLKKTMSTSTNVGDYYIEDQGSEYVLFFVNNNSRKVLEGNTKLEQLYKIRQKHFKKRVRECLS